MASRPITFGEIMQEIKTIFPRASYETCRRYLNNEIIAMATKFRMKLREEKIDVKSGIRKYDIGDLNTNFGVNKVIGVAMIDSDGEYKIIPRITDPGKILIADES